MTNPTDAQSMLPATADPQSRPGAVRARILQEEACLLRAIRLENSFARQMDLSSEIARLRGERLMHQKSCGCERITNAMQSALSADATICTGMRK